MRKREIGGVMGMVVIKFLAHMKLGSARTQNKRSYKKIFIHLAKNEYLKNALKKLSLKMQK